MSSKIGEQGSLCSSIFFSALTEGPCTPRGRVGSIRYVESSIITALYRGVFYQPLAVEISPTAGVNYLP